MTLQALQLLVIAVVVAYCVLGYLVCRGRRPFRLMMCVWIGIVGLGMFLTWLILW